jgi:REP-associated tyrosine transposase
MKSSMSYNPQLHHRRSIRLKGYDYSSAGHYFITICTQNRDHLFGKINNRQMQLNNAGQMIEKIWIETVNQYPNIKLDEYIIMPNHFHGIVTITPTVASVWDDSISFQNTDFISQQNADSFSQQNTDSLSDIHNGNGGIGIEMDSTQLTGIEMDSTLLTGIEMDSTPTIDIPSVIQSFKRHSTIKYIEMVKSGILPPFHKRIWQRNYWEHIVRNKNEYLRISQYIKNNPHKW